MTDITHPPFALSVFAGADLAFDIADQLGFDGLDAALSVAVFEDGVSNQFKVQALFDNKRQADAALKTVAADYPSLKMDVGQLPDEDWVSLSQAGLPAVVAGRFTIHGSHDAPSGEIPICIDAGMAFGTGHHGTTAGCLRIYDRLLAEGHSIDSILDLGTGAGILAIAAAKASPDASILATDIEQDAVDVALANAAANGVTFEVIRADGFDHPRLIDAQYDLIFANILARPLRGMAPDIAPRVTEHGHIILSGILDEQAEWVADAFRAQGLAVDLQDSLEGWTSLLARRA